MASIKEREKWERWYFAVDARMKRQRDALTRIVLLLTESAAALEEIAAMNEYTSIKEAQERAKQALDRIKEPAAAAAHTVEELDSEEAVEDPRRNQT